MGSTNCKYKLLRSDKSVYYILGLNAVIDECTEKIVLLVVNKDNGYICHIELYKTSERFILSSVELMYYEMPTVLIFTSDKLYKNIFYNELSFKDSKNYFDYIVDTLNENADNVPKTNKRMQLLLKLFRSEFNLKECKWSLNIEDFSDNNLFRLTKCF